ncbi:MAG TPA: arginase [Vicinamibacteria bacterium]|nr:arginase [Vicinamibacteria bacterium]
MDVVRVIGVRIDLGAGRRGVDMGPSAMRKAGIRERIRALGYEVADDGNIFVDEPETLEVNDPKLRYLPQIASAMENLAARVEGAMAAGEIPMVLGGDHSIAIGTVAGVASHFRKSQKKLGMIWFDAHGDSNTPDTSPSGNIHGMPQAVIFGRGAKELVRIGGFAENEAKLDPKCSCIIGARSIDRAEKAVIEEIGLRVFTMDQIDRRGMYDITCEALEIANRATDGMHVSLDVDVIDPSVAPGVGTPVRGGLTYRETHTAMELVAESGRMVSMEIAEVNPILDIRNSTAEVAVEMVASAFGQRIL